MVGAPRLSVAIFGFVLLFASAGFLLAGAAPSAFTEEALLRGLDFTMGPYPQVQGYVGHGSGFVDLDSDGDPDVVLIGRADGMIGIFENIGGGFFADHTLTSGIPAMTQQEGVAAADYDADGFLDLYITQAINKPNYLMKNNGNFTFSHAISANVSNGAQNSTGATWADYNDDGWLDLYVCNYGPSNANALYVNNGLGGFSNQAFSQGVAASGALSFQTVWSDYDRDGDVDLYLSNDRGELGFPPNVLWRNDGGTFVDVSAGSGADVAIFSMGIAAGDLDDNLYPDFYLTNINSVESDGSPNPYDGINPLLLNQGDGTFVESAETWGVDNRITSWAAIFFDWNNDTYKDLYVNNQFEPNSFFVGGDIPYVEMAQPLAVVAEYDPDYDFSGDLPTIASYGSTIADVDGDGDLDLLVNNLGYRAELFINQEGQKHNWVRYNVVGEYPNLFAIGGNAETTAAGKTQFHEIYAGGNGYLGQNERVIHVGLGDASAVDEAVFRWPSNGPARTLTGLPAREIWSIYPPSRLCDAEGDADVDYDDFLAFADCFLAGFSPGCEMMDENGNSIVYADDLETCFVTVPLDCNGNGTEDLAEIMLDLTLDANQNSRIDCCDSGPANEPNAVGATLLLERSAADEPLLTWSAPGPGPGNGPATSYDVFRSVTVPLQAFGLRANVGVTSYTDDDAPDVAFYVVSARNGCGSSGEEPF